MLVIKGNECYSGAEDIPEHEILFTRAVCYFYGLGGYEQDMKKAERFSIYAVNKGSADAIVLLGDMYLVKDRDKALDLYLKAAEEGSGRACYRLARYHMDITDDKDRTLYWIEKGSGFRHPGCMFYYGLALMKGKYGLTRDRVNGMKLLKESADRGNWSAALEYGGFLLAENSEKNHKEALRYFMMAEDSSPIARQAAERIRNKYYEKRFWE